MRKWLFLNEAEAALVIQAVNGSKVSSWDSEQLPEVNELVQKLGRYLVASGAELKEEHSGSIERRPQTRKGCPNQVNYADQALIIRKPT